MTTAVKTTLDISSPAFQNEGMIPKKYTCDGEGKNPPIRIGELPEQTRSLVLIVEDPDAPGRIFDHWIVWNIPPLDVIEEDSKPGHVGRNGKGEPRYTGPCPPSGSHRYFFKLYALDQLLFLDAGATKNDIIEAMQNHILGYGELIGIYKRQD
jgi:Raf kinase inhibitor-like YbhB/YbcL family protein